MRAEIPAYLLPACSGSGGVRCDDDYAVAGLGDSKRYVAWCHALEYCRLTLDDDEDAPAVSALRADLEPHL